MWTRPFPRSLFFRSLIRARKWTAIIFTLITAGTVLYRNFIIRCDNAVGQLAFQYDTDYNESLIDVGGQESHDDWRPRPPRALIIGVRKGGTRALLDALALNPKIRIARHEVHFFDKAENFERGVNWYLQQMPASFSDQITIEKTPAYFVNPTVADRIFDFDPDIKLILIVRDPVARLISDFTQVVHTRMEHNKSLVSFEDAIFVAGVHQLNRTCKPVRNSLYAQHLERWLRRFSLHQLHVVDGDRFIKDPLYELRDVEQFLGITPAIESNQLVYNGRKGFYCFRYKTGKIPRCLGATKGRAQIQVDAKTQREVAQLFRDGNERFFKQIGRRFDNWL